MSGIGRVAIVTGGAGAGIGGAVSRVLAERGDDVLIVDRDELPGAELVDELNATGRSAKFLCIDLTTDEAPDLIVAAAIDWKGRIDALVNNAGIGCVAHTSAVDDAAFDATFGVNLRAAFRLTRQVTPRLPQSSGAIVNIASVHGRQSLPGFSVYAATKGAIEAITRGWAIDFGKRGIRVNAVLPGMVDCPQTRQVISKYESEVDSYLQSWIDARQLLPSLVRSTDVGELVSFLLSSRSAGLTGQSILIDAGTSIMLTDSK